MHLVRTLSFLISFLRINLPLLFLNLPHAKSNILSLFFVVSNNIPHLASNLFLPETVMTLVKMAKHTHATAFLSFSFLHFPTGFGRLGIVHPGALPAPFCVASPGWLSFVRRSGEPLEGVQRQQGSPSSSPLVRPSPSESFMQSAFVHRKPAAMKSRPNWLRGAPLIQPLWPSLEHVIPEPGRSEAMPLGTRPRYSGRARVRVSKAKMRRMAMFMVAEAGGMREKCE